MIQMVSSQNRTNRYNVEADCVLCSQNEETTQYSLFDCSFSCSTTLSRFGSQVQESGIWSLIGLSVSAMAKSFEDYVCSCCVSSLDREECQNVWEGYILCTWRACSY